MAAGKGKLIMLLLYYFLQIEAMPSRIALLSTPKAEAVGYHEDRYSSANNFDMTSFKRTTLGDLFIGIII